MVEFLAHRWLDIVLALVFALFADLVRVGSLVRGTIRKFENWFSEYSTARMQKRIQALERQRRRSLEYLESDKFVYLDSLYAILMSMYLAVGAMSLFVLYTMLERVGPPKPSGGLGALGAVFAMCVGAMVIALKGANGTYTKGRSGRVKQFVKRLDAEIAELKAKLAERTAKV